MKVVSLQSRLTAILLTVAVGVWLLSAFLTIVHARQMIHRHIDRQLTASVELSSHMLQGVMEDPSVGSYFEKRAVTLSSNPSQRRVTGYSSQGDAQAVNLWFSSSQVLVGATTPPFPRPRAAGAVTETIGEGDAAERWRIHYRLLPGHDIWIAAGVNLEQAERGARDMLWGLLLPLLIVLPIITALLVMGVRRGLRPLNELADTIAARDPLDEQPIGVNRAPAEILPLVTALNGLLERLQRALVSEQRFTANAAHELQTPLAAIKAEVQRYQRLAADAETQQMLARLSTRVSRATASVSQLLTLARLDPDQRFTQQPITLADALLEVMAELGGLAMERDITFQLDAPGPAVVPGQPDWLHILLRNLLLNALQYAPAGTTVDIGIRVDGTGTAVSIANACSAIAHADLTRLGERFFRPADNPTPGVGLGLSIVQRIATLHGATVRLEQVSESTGFRATITFPLPR